MREKLAEYRLNLASRPFINLTLPWIIAGVLLLAATVFTLFNVITIFSATSDSGETAEKIQQLNEEMDAMRAEISTIDNRLRSINPDKIRREVSFANDLIVRRTMSWSTVFDRLEEIAPAQLKMVRISPQTSQGKVLLNMRVIVPRQNVIRAFITDMEASPYFSDVLLQSEVTDIKIGQMVWELSAIYHEQGEVS